MHHVGIIEELKLTHALNKTSMPKKDIHGPNVVQLSSM